MITRGRGGWTGYGMPDADHNGVGDTRYYCYQTPEQVGQRGAQFPGDWKGATLFVNTSQDDFDAFAVSRGVRSIQRRINRMGFTPTLPESGIVDAATDVGIVWAQRKLSVTIDGFLGPETAQRMFWPAVKAATDVVTPIVALRPVVAHVVGGICQHESAFDPGAVGYSTPLDLGPVQINGPANPNMTADQRFMYTDAYQYAARRIYLALSTPGWNIDAAIASYGYPAVATYWVKSGTQTYPQDPKLNQLALDYVSFVKAWMPPS